MWQEVAAAHAARADDTIYGSTSRSSGGSVVIVQVETQDYTTVGAPFATGPLPAIAMNGAGELFVSNNVTSGETPKVGALTRVDATTGAVLQVVGIITDTADSEPLTIRVRVGSTTDHA